MKTLSYTQMRNELSEVLEALRSGEEVVITQRGKPNLILNGVSLEKEEPSNAESMLASNLNEKMASLGKRLVTEHTHGFTLTYNDGSIVTHDFKTALKRTKAKHARTIKALGDK